MKKEFAMSIDRENSEKADADTAVSILSWLLDRGALMGRAARCYRIIQNRTAEKD